MDTGTFPTSGQFFLYIVFSMKLYKSHVIDIIHVVEVPVVSVYFSERTYFKLGYYASKAEMSIPKLVQTIVEQWLKARETERGIPWLREHIE